MVFGSDFGTKLKNLEILLQELQETNFKLNTNKHKFLYQHTQNFNRWSKSITKTYKPILYLNFNHQKHLEM